ncbi:hypothetical protein RDWZM_009945 [Blomia tropicalis]|uniref:ABC transporter domain-containing protein n=1 Tax=Blomia tropicalis TaxID=40697 RepID=A0A9Q0LXJ6_BLOTA|nr:hypothetical protein RDWZM_009945 [Blomia tropicalis]
MHRQSNEIALNNYPSNGDEQQRQHQHQQQQQQQNRRSNHHNQRYKLKHNLKRSTSTSPDDWIVDMMNNNNNNNNNNDSSIESELTGIDGRKVNVLKGANVRMPIIQMINVTIHNSNGNINNYEDDDNQQQQQRRQASKPSKSIINRILPKSSSITTKNDNIYFDSLNQSFESEQIIAIIGDIGTGKTILLETLAKYRRPFRGTIRWRGLAPSADDQSNQMSCGFMSQHDGFFSTLTPVENVEYFARLYGLDSDSVHGRLNRLMTMIGWKRKAIESGRLKPIHQTMLSLTIASIHSPSILLMDEPQFGCDLLLKERIWTQLKRLTISDHVTIIFTTTNVEDVRFADQAMIIRNRKLISCRFEPEPLSNETIYEKNSSSSSSFDVYRLISLNNVNKIRQCAIASYDNKVNIDDENGGEMEHEIDLNGTKIKKTTTNNDIQLDMNENRSHHSNGRKRVQYERSYIGKLWLTIIILVRLQMKRQLFTLGQLIGPSLIVWLFAQYVGQNPFQIRLAVYNPDTPAIVSRHVMNTIDRHTIHLVEYDTLNETLDSVREHHVWGAIEFPSNYTNSMINRALQNIDTTNDEFDDDPESEPISGHLMMEKNDSKDENVNVDKNSDADLERMMRDRSRLVRSHETEDENDDDDDVDDESGTNSTEIIHELSNDLDINRMKIKPINMITIRLYVDNTNQLVAGFIKMKLFDALQRAQADPAVAMFAPKIPTPLEIVQPNIYGHDDSTMSEFLLPGTLVAIIFLTSSIIPIGQLISIRTNQSFRQLRSGGIGQIQLTLGFLIVQLPIQLIQIAISLIILTNFTTHPIDGPISITLIILLLQSIVALLSSTLWLDLMPKSFSTNIISIVAIQSSYFVILFIFGSIYWPIECLPLVVRSFALYIFPQTIGSESLRYVFSRGWGFERYGPDPNNSIIWYGINLPIGWIISLFILILIMIKIRSY